MLCMTAEKGGSRMKKLTIIVMLSVALFSCKTAEEALRESGKQPLSANAIRSALSNNTIHAYTPSGADYTIYFRANGTLHIKSPRVDDNGKWSTEGNDKYCVKYDVGRGGQKYCYRIYELGSEYAFYTEEGTERHRFTILKGNPDKL